VEKVKLFQQGTKAATGLAAVVVVGFSERFSATCKLAEKLGEKGERIKTEANAALEALFAKMDTTIVAARDELGARRTPAAAGPHQEQEATTEGNSPHGGTKVDDVADQEMGDGGKEEEAADMQLAQKAPRVEGGAAAGQAGASGSK
jgi:hypothetical protein